MTGAHAGPVQQQGAAGGGAELLEWMSNTPIQGPAPAFPETMEAGHARYTAALHAIADRHAGQNVLVVTHGEAVRRSIARLVRPGSSCTVHSTSHGSPLAGAGLKERCRLAADMMHAM